MPKEENNLHFPVLVSREEESKALWFETETSGTSGTRAETPRTSKDDDVETTIKKSFAV